MMGKGEGIRHSLKDSTRYIRAIRVTLIIDRGDELHVVLGSRSFTLLLVVLARGSAVLFDADLSCFSGGCDEKSLGDRASNHCDAGYHCRGDFAGYEGHGADKSGRVLRRESGHARGRG
ncbi:protein of unknown function [Candidatus Promineifilum breve]|uniref:Uncharacterized protein n=1 Tax=Candidatus Promineifilum breve TaxID=1806508 RepID=A0A160T4D3_9CHLR|nr:protein of unknown function [Candidatus Promineifilum breve]